MVDERKSAVQPRRSRSWRRWLLIGLAALFLVLAVFHGPILRPVVHAVVVKAAAGQNLKLDLRVEGNVLGGITLRNVHATPTGPSAVQLLDVGVAKVEYNLLNLLFRGMSDALKNVEVHDVTAVLDSSKAPVPAPAAPPRPNEKVRLPAFFPDRLEATNVNLTIRRQPQDIVIKNLTLGLYPNREGRLQIEKVQIQGVHTWTNISATTTYANRNLFLHNLTLDENNRLPVVNIDASKLGQGRLGLKLQGGIGGGNIASQLEISARGPSYDTSAQVQASGISLGQLAEYLGQPAGRLAGDVKNVRVDLRGRLDGPSTWQGTIEADLGNVRRDKLALDRVKLDVRVADGRATVREARIDQGNNHLRLRGSIDLPKSKEGLGQTPGNFQFSVDAPELARLTAFLNPPVSGSLQASGSLKIENQILHLDLSASGAQIAFRGASAEKLSLTVAAGKKMSRPNDKKALPIYDGLISSLRTQLTDVRYGDRAIGEVEATATSDGAQVSLASVTATRKNNLLRLSGSFRLPSPNEKLMEQPADFQLTFRAPQLADYWQSEALNKVTGALQADGSVRIRKGVASGQLNLFGEQLAARKLLVKHLSGQVAIAENVVYLNDFTATVNERNYVVANGTVQLQKPFHYTGSVTANLADLSTFEPLLRREAPGRAGSSTPVATGRKATPPAGSLVVNWNGQGDVATSRKNGDLKLKLERARYADLRNLHADIEAHYTSREFNIPVFSLGSDQLNLEAVVQARNATIEFSKIEVSQGRAQFGTAYAAIPFVWNNIGAGRPLVPRDGKVLISFQSENLDFARLFQNIGVKPPVAGLLSVKLDVKGPVQELEGRLDLQMHSLRAAAVPRLEPATFNLTARLQNNELRVDGSIQQARVQPVQVQGRLPLDISKMLEERKFDEQAPVDVTVRMPPSPVNFLRQFIPELRDLDGSLALNMRVGGTIAQPLVSGSAEARINVARLENATIPALTNFRAQLNFRDNALSFDRFGGDLAGGPFTVTGRIALPKLTEPTFDLRLKGNSVLVARNDTVTVRVDADLRVEGPLRAAAVSGQVLTTNSRFLKNIDIIPIGLPGRPVRRPPEFTPVLSFPSPLRDWKFDVTIKSKDPFLIRGNLATGEAIIDLKLDGTGLRPGLQGQVRLSDFEATLPFSRLTVRYGFLFFDRDDPLNPRIELHGTSRVRDYTIHVFVYGTARAPEAVFNSEPPLPQEEIISLLATGVTREELTGGGNVLASRAAILLLRQLYRKIFRQGDEMESTESVFDRLDVEFGNIDPRTGQQTTTASFRMTDNILLLGEIGVGGDFSGLVKYVIRFR